MVASVKCHVPMSSKFDKWSGKMVVYMVKMAVQDGAQILSAVHFDHICSGHGSYPPHMSVSNRWTGIWNGTVEWKMKWNSDRTQL